MPEGKSNSVEPFVLTDPSYVFVAGNGMRFLLRPNDVVGGPPLIALGDGGKQLIYRRLVYSAFDKWKGITAFDPLTGTELQIGWPSRVEDGVSIRVKSDDDNLGRESQQSVRFEHLADSMVGQTIQIRSSGWPFTPGLVGKSRSGGIFAISSPDLSKLDNVAWDFPAEENEMPPHMKESGQIVYERGFIETALQLELLSPPDLGSIYFGSLGRFIEPVSCTEITCSDTRENISLTLSGPLPEGGGKLTVSMTLKPNRLGQPRVGSFVIDRGNGRAGDLVEHPIGRLDPLRDIVDLEPTYPDRPPRIRVMSQQLSRSLGLPS